MRGGGGGAAGGACEEGGRVGRCRQDRGKAVGAGKRLRAQEHRPCRRAADRCTAGPAPALGRFSPGHCANVSARDRGHVWDKGRTSTAHHSVLRGHSLAAVQAPHRPSALKPHLQARRGGGGGLDGPRHSRASPKGTGTEALAPHRPPASQSSVNPVDSRPPGRLHRDRS